MAALRTALKSRGRKVVGQTVTPLTAAKALGRMVRGHQAGPVVIVVVAAAVAQSRHAANLKTSREGLRPLMRGSSRVRVRARA